MRHPNPVPTQTLFRDGATLFLHRVPLDSSIPVVARRSFLNVRTPLDVCKDSVGGFEARPDLVIGITRIRKGLLTAQFFQYL